MAERWLRLEAPATEGQPPKFVSGHPHGRPVGSAAGRVGETMRIPCLMVLLAGLGLLTGCGGRSSDSIGSTAATGELSKSEWLAQAQEICKAEEDDVAPLNKELDRLNDSGLSAPSEIAEFAAILRKALPRSQQALREMRELEPPSRESEAIHTLLGKAEETLDLLEETAEEMEEGNAAKAKLFSFKTAMAKRTGEWMAQRDGLDVCAAEK